jgi:uncharacterized membrane protein
VRVVSGKANRHRHTLYGAVVSMMMMMVIIIIIIIIIFKFTHLSFEVE